VGRKAHVLANEGARTAGKFDLDRSRSARDLKTHSGGATGAIRGGLSEAIRTGTK